MVRALVVLVLSLAGSNAWPTGSESPDADRTNWERQVLKVTVQRRDGGREFGSAVPLAGERMVTNCHVLRDADEISVATPDRSWKATTDASDVYRDLCFLRVPGFDASPTPMIEVGATHVGLKVSAVGFSEGRFKLTRGTVVGMYTCECDGGKIIQTSAQFERGASGGGLFDQAGRLVGILTFKSRSGGKYHFALPVGWLRHVAVNRLEAIDAADPFWQKPGKESAHFLAACDLGARKAWGPLGRLAEDWIEQEPNNPEAWMVRGRASLGLNRREQAIASFQHVLMLESTHAEARWELQKLEFDLGRKLLDTGAI